MLANPDIMVSDVGRRLGITRHALPLFACGKDSARPTTPIGAHQEFCTALRRQWHQRLRRRRNEVQKCNATPAATPFRNVHFTSTPPVAGYSSFVIRGTACSGVMDPLRAGLISAQKRPPNARTICQTKADEATAPKENTRFRFITARVEPAKSLARNAQMR
jgi:hypothetical protein